MKTIHNRIYSGIIVGIAIRGSIANDRTFRVRRGNGYYTSIAGAEYQDQYGYFVPTSITNVQSEPYRRQWIAAVAKWKYGLTAAEKKAYNARATRGLRMSGYNLFMREAMKGLVDMFVDRGDPAAYDWAKTDLTTDGAWHDLDISSIVPKSAKAILIIGHLVGNGVDWTIRFKKYGQTNDINLGCMETIRAMVDRRRMMICAVDSNQKVQYKIDNKAWSTLELAIRGWWT